MRFSNIILLLLFVRAHAQGNKEQFLEQEFVRENQNSAGKSPTRPPSMQARVEPAPTPKPVKGRNDPPTRPPTAASKTPTVSARVPTASNPTRPPTRRGTKQPTPQKAAATTSSPSQMPSANPTTMEPSRSPSVSPAPTLSPTISAFPTKEPTESPSKSPSSVPSVSPSLSPTMGPSAQPSAHPSDQPSGRPTVSLYPSASPTESGAPSLSPSSSPTNLPSASPSVIPSFSPSDEPSSAPSSSPSSQPSCRPTLSSAPSEVPTNSMMPSMMPSRGPSTVPSLQPSENPTTEPSFFPSELPSASPSSLPSQVPSELPTRQPSSAPTESAQPSMAPSQSMLPTETGYEELEAELAVPVRSSSLMDGPTAAVFETTTMDFLNEYLPSSDSVVVTLVEVTDQTLEERRKLSRDLQVTDLKVNILVKATWFAGNATEVYPLESNTEKTFEKHYEVFASKLVDASSFFRVSFQATGRSANTESPEDGSPLTGSTLIIVCAVAGCALLALFSAFFVWRIHSRRSTTAADNNPSLGLPSWSSQEISASSGYLSNGSMESPTESEIYTRQNSRRSLFSERDSQGSGSQRSMSERSDSPTVGSPYNTGDDKSIDTNFSNSDRYLQNPNPYSPFSSLAPVDENSQMTDIDLTTPRNGTTPRGSEFFEVQRFSAASITPTAEHVTPKHARFEDCDVRSPKVAFVNKANTPKGTQFMQLNTTSAEKTGSIIDDLTRFERAWDSELDSKVNAVTETPKANNLERYKKAPRSILYSNEKRYL